MLEIYKKITGEEIEPDSAQPMLKNAIAMSHLNYAEILYYPHINKNTIQDIVSIEGRHQLDAAVSKRNGVILAFYHFGAQKLIIPALGYRDYPTHQLAAPPTIWKELEDPSRKSKMFLHSLELEMDCEKNFPVNFHYIGKNIRPLVKCLRNSEVLLYAVDGGYGGKKTIETRLGGLKFNIADTPFRLSRATGASILPAFLIHGSDGKHVLHVHEPLAMPPHQTDFSENAQQLTDILYHYFKQHPSHYLGQLWLYNKMGRIDITAQDS